MSSPEEREVEYRERLFAAQKQHAEAILVEAKRQSVALESVANLLAEYAVYMKSKEAPEEVEFIGSAILERVEKMRKTPHRFTLLDASDTSVIRCLVCHLPKGIIAHDFNRAGGVEVKLTNASVQAGSPKCVECGTPEYVVPGLSMASSTWLCRRCGWASVDGLTWCQPPKSANTIVEQDQDVASVTNDLTEAHVGISGAIFDLQQQHLLVPEQLSKARRHIDLAIDVINDKLVTRVKDAEKRARENQEDRSQALRVLDEVRDKRDALAAKNNALFADYEALLVIHAQLTRSAKDHDARVEQLLASESAALEKVAAAEQRVRHASATCERAIADALHLAREREGAVIKERARVTDAVVAEYERMRNAGRMFQFDVADIRMAAAPDYVPVKAL